MSLKAGSLELVEVEFDRDTRLLPCRIRRSSRARRINIRVLSDGEVVLTLPRRCSKHDGVAFLQSKSRWVERKLSEPSPNPSLEQHFESGGRVYVDDSARVVGIMVISAPRRISWSLEKDGELELKILEDVPREPQLLELLLSFAKERLPSLVFDLAAEAGEEVAKVRVGNQRTRWGSCSEKGTISLNWRVVLLEPCLRDYVILHEIAHLRHMNHSDAFWLGLEELYSNARLADRRLNELGRNLMALGH